MNNVEYLIKIHDVSTDNSIENIVNDYLNSGYTIKKIEPCDTTKYTFYLEKPMSYNLFLDDERMPHNVTWVKLPENVEWTIVRSYKQFVDAIAQRGLPHHISFDHDLSDTAYIECRQSIEKENTFNYSNVPEKTGLQCAEFVAEFCIKYKLPYPKYTVHSMNFIGKQNIISKIESFKKVHTL